VTYFWNGNRSGYIDEKLEKYVEIPSDKIEFDKAPQMKAKEITAAVIELLKNGDYKFGRNEFPERRYGRTHGQNGGSYYRGGDSG